jgi:hypothetical protein
MLDGAMLKLSKNKFTKKDWDIIRYHVEGWRGEIHHACGRQYEWLSTLVPMSSEEHRGAGHHKYTHGQIPEMEAILNIAKWQKILGEDFEIFAENDLLGI